MNNIKNETCLYCDSPAIAYFCAVADPEDVMYSGYVCAYHWRYTQLRHRHGTGLSLMSADAIDGRELTKPFRPFPQRYVNDIWPVIPSAAVLE